MQGITRTALMTMVLIGLAGGQARAATTVGQTALAESGGGCGTHLALQTGSPNDQSVIPTVGVLTTWQYLTTANPPQIKFKVARPAGTNTFTIVGESVQHTLAANGLNSFPTRIPVQPGDVLGAYFATVGDCYQEVVGPEGYGFHLGVNDVPVGTTTNLGPPPPVTPQRNYGVAAILEADADGDGFGDETQDACPADPAIQVACSTDLVAPTTKITKGAPNKTAKSKAKFKFSADEPGSTFECKLKGRGLDQSIKQFNACESPRTYKGLDRGRYRFNVRAIDAAGNVDSTPAKDRFRVVG